jgi:hypothetical protein
MVEFAAPIQTAEQKVGNHALGAGSQLREIAVGVFYELFAGALI